MPDIFDQLASQSAPQRDIFDELATPPTEEQQHANDAADYRGYQIARRDALAQRQQSFERNVLNPISWAHYLTGQQNEAAHAPVETIYRGIVGAGETAGILPEGSTAIAAQPSRTSPIQFLPDFDAGQGRIYNPPSKTLQVAAGLGNSIKRVAEFLTTPDGLLLLFGGGRAPNPVSARQLSGTFAANLAIEAPTQFHAADEALQQGDYQKAGEAIGGFIVSAGGAAGAARHAFTGPGPRVTTTLSRYNPWMPPRSDLSRYRRTGEPETTGEINASAIREDQGQLPPPGQVAQEGEVNRSPNLESPSPGQPQPVEPGAQKPAPGAEIGDIVEAHGYVGELKQEGVRRVVQTNAGTVELAPDDVPAVRLGVRPDGTIIRNGEVFEPSVGAAKPWSNAYDREAGRFRIRSPGGGNPLVLEGDMARHVAARLTALEPAKTPVRRAPGVAEPEAGLAEVPAENIDTPVDTFVLNQQIEAEKLKGGEQANAKEKVQEEKGGNGRGGLAPAMHPWVREAMIAAGLDPARPLNDIDLQNQSVRDAIAADPTLSADEKAQLLKTGSKKAALPESSQTAEPPAVPASHEAAPQSVSEPPAREPITPVKVKKQFFIRKRPDGVVDVLDAIQELGGIRPPKPGEKGGEWDGWKESMVGTARLLINRKSKHTPDTIIGELQKDFPRIESADHLYEAIGRAMSERDKLRASGGGAMAQQERFVHAMSPANTKGMVKINADDLKIGDKFQLRGPEISDEVLEVTFIDPDNGEVQVSDGRLLGIQQIPEGAELWVQKKGLDIKPVEEGAGFPAEEPFALGKPESTEEQKARVEAEQKAAEVRRLREEKEAAEATKVRKAKEQGAAPLGGDLGTAGAGKLFEEPGQQEIFAPKAPAPKPEPLSIAKKFPRGLTVINRNGAWEVVDANTDKTLLRRVNETDARNQAQALLDALQGKPQFSMEEVDVRKIVIPSAEAVQKHEALEDLVNGWARHISAPVKVIVVTDPDFIMHDGKPWSGWYKEANNVHTVVLNAAAIQTPTGAFRVFIHELVGHFGLQQVLGDQYNARLDRWFGEIMSDKVEGAKLMERALSYGYADKDNFLSDQARRSAVEEYIAKHFAERGGIVERIVDWIKDAFYKLTGQKPTDREIRTLIRQSRRYLKESKTATTGKGTRYSLAQTEEEARDIAARTTKRNRQLEGESLTGQATDIAAVLAKHSPAGLSPGAAEHLGTSDYRGVAEAGRSMTGALDDYRTLKAKYGQDSYDLVSITRPAATQMLKFDDTLKRIIAKRDDEMARLSKPGVARLLARESLAKAKALNAENVLEQSKAIFSSAHKLAETALAKEAKDDVRAAVLQGRLNQIDEMSKSSSAIEQVVNDMVNVVSSTQGGIDMLANPKVQARSLSTLYQDVKKSTGQRLHSQALIDWSAYILSKSAKLREQLLAAKFATDPGVRRLLDPYQAKFLSEYEANPVKTVDAALRMRGKLTTAQERTAYAWQALNDRVLEQFKGFGDLIHAGDVAEKVLADKDFTALRTEILQDARIKGRTAPYSYRQGESMVLPDASVLELSGKFDLTGSKAEHDAKLKEMEQAREQLKDYLATATPDDPDYWTHAENLKMLDALYMTDSVTRPKDAIRLVKTAFGTLNGVLARIGGRPAAIVTALARNFEETNKRAAHWRDVWTTSVSLARAKAIDSHGFRKGMSLADANRKWNEEIGWELADSLQDPQGGLRVGDKTMFGHTITREDLDDVRTASQGTTQAFGIVQGYERKNGTVNERSAGAGLGAFRPQLTKDTLGGVTYWRDALKGSEFMVPRGINEDRLGFAEKFSEAYATENQPLMEQLLNDNFGFVRSFIRDRRYQGATAGPFDGDSGPYSLLSKRLADGYYGSAHLDFDWLVKELSDLSSLSPDETRDLLIKDMGTTVSRLWRQEKPQQGPNIGRSEDTKNSFTRSRNDKIAPYWFYETGFKDQNSILGFAANISSHALDDVVNGMKVAITDIERQEQDLFARASKVGTKQAMTENAVARKNGDTYDNWKNLEWRKNQLGAMINDLTVDRYDAQQNMLLRRLIGVGIQSKLTSTPTTARNLTSAPAYLGARLARLTQSNWLGYAPAFYQTWIPGLFKTLYAVGKHELIAKGVRIPQGAIKAVGQAAREGFALKKFVHTLGRDNLVEITDRLYDDLKTAKEMERRGITFTPDFVKDYDSRFLVSMRDAGMIPGQVESPGREAAKTVLGAIELGFGADAKATHPFIGDLAINSAAYQAMMSSAGPFQTMQKQLARLYRDWTSSGGKLRQFDFANPNSPVNQLSAKEVYPSVFKGGARLFSTESGYNAAMKMYQQAGVDFQQAAIKYLADLHAGKPDAQFMTEEQRGAMTSSMIDWVNRSTVAGSPQALRKAHWLNQIVAPFLNWPVRTAGALLDDLQIASKDPDTRRAVAAGMVALGVALPFVVGSMATDVSSEEADRAIKRLLYNQTKATRQPWEREGAKSQAIGWALSAANTVPFLDKIMNAALNDLPTRGRQDFSLVAIETLKDISKYVGGVMQTGDVRYKLPELLSSLIPETKAIVNRLPGVEGNRESSNVVALIRRHGPVDLLRPTGDSGGTGVNVTGLTPYADRMVNAAMQGDLASFSDLYSQAVAKATELGRTDPEKLVAQLFTSRSPYNRAFKAKLTPDQRQEFLSKLSDSERATVEDTEQKFQNAAASLNKTITFAKTPSSPGGTGGSVGPSAGTGRVSASVTRSSPLGTARVTATAPTGSFGTLRRAGRTARVTARRSRGAGAPRTVRSARVRVPRLSRAGRGRAARV